MVGAIGGRKKRSSVLEMHARIIEGILLLATRSVWRWRRSGLGGLPSKLGA